MFSYCMKNQLSVFSLKTIEKSYIKIFENLNLSNSRDMNTRRYLDDNIDIQKWINKFKCNLSNFQESDINLMTLLINSVLSFEDVCMKEISLNIINKFFEEKMLININECQFNNFIKLILKINIDITNKITGMANITGII